MAVTRDNNVIRMTANADTITLGGNIKVAGARLVSAAATSTAAIYDSADNTGPIMAKFNVVANAADEMDIPFNMESGSIYITLTGTGAELFIYLK